MRSLLPALARTIIMTAVLAGIVLTVFWRLSTDRQQKQVAELEALNEELSARLAAREAMIERLERSRRVAMVEVLRQERGREGEILSTTVLLVELDEDGTEIARRSYTLPGDVVTIDAMTVKFHHDQVAEGHPLAGRTLLLLRRIYSDRMRPVDGFTIDTPGAVPPAYAVSELGRFQRQLWEHFWRLASDAEFAATMGVRVAQGEAVYKPVREGQVYELAVDASGGMNLTPIAVGANARPSEWANVETSRF